MLSLKILRRILKLALWIPELKSLPITKLKSFIWETVILQEFFDCTGSLPINKRTILLETNCYADAIVMLVEKLERKFVHLHPALQTVFYEVPKINHPIAKKIATIILMREFDFIIQEASDIFTFYKKMLYTLQL